MRRAGVDRQRREAKRWNWGKEQRCMRESGIIWRSGSLAQDPAFNHESIN